MALNNENNNECCKCTTPEYELVLNEQGPQGRQGKKGDAGFTPIISVKDNTDSNYTLNILTQDGQITTPNLKANLPAGGATGQVLTKNSGEQDDCSWQNLPASTIETEGIARLATEADFETTDDTEANDNTIVTPALFNNELKAQVNTFIVAGDNITTSVGEDGKVTINAEAEPYSLPQANATTLGGVKANPKSDEDTQAVNIDPATGLLYTKAGGGSTDITSFYQLDYGTKSGSIPVTFSGNDITLKSGIPITTPNGTFSYTSDITYQYTFETERTIFAYKDSSGEDYYNVLAVYYGGSQPATNPQGQIAWFDNNVWKLISATGEITTFSTQLITPIAKVYLNGNNVKSIDYASYYKIDISNPTPANMVTTDTNQKITGQKEFTNTILSLDRDLIRGQESETYRYGAGLTMGDMSSSTDGGSFAPQWKIYNSINEINRVETIITSYNQSKLNATNFNTANKLVRLDSAGKLPAIDGSQLTNLPSSTPTNMVTTNTAQDITANKAFKQGSLLFYNDNKPTIGISNMGTAISMSYEGNLSDDSAQMLRDTSSDWRVGCYNKQGIISSSTPLQRMGAGPYFNKYPILDSSNLGSYVDGTTITYTDGKLKASGGSTPTNMVTTDTNQTITGGKTFNKIVLPDDSFSKGIYIGDNAEPSIFAYNNFLSIANLLNLTIKSSLYMVGTNPSLDLGDYTNGAKFTINLCGSDGNSTTKYPIIKVNNITKKIVIGNDTFSITDNNGNNIVTTNDIGNLKYWTGTEAAYTELTSKDADTLYRTTDTNKVYLGTIQIGGNA